MFYFRMKCMRLRKNSNFFLIYERIYELYVIKVLRKIIKIKFYIILVVSFNNHFNSIYKGNTYQLEDILKSSNFLREV